MADNDAFATAATPFGTVGLLAPLVPDVTLVHGAVADQEGNVALSEPLLEGAWGAWAARRGVIATVEKVVENLDGLGHRTKIPAHRVLAVVEAPFGAHPGGLYAPGLPVDSYGEDIAFWTEARAATRGDFDAWARHWVLEPTTHGGLSRPGGTRPSGLAVGPHRPDVLASRRRGPPGGRGGAGQRLGAGRRLRRPRGAGRGRERRRRRRRAGRRRRGQPGRLGGGGPGRRRRAPGEAHGRARHVGLPPDPGRPLHLQPPGVSRAHHCWPTPPPFWAWSSAVPGTRTVACLGAAQIDRDGNLNSTSIPGGPFPGGVGGRQRRGQPGHLLRGGVAGPSRTAGRAGGLRHQPGRQGDAHRHRPGCAPAPSTACLRIAAVPSGAGSVAERVQALADVCGWDVETVREVEELDPVTTDEVMALRRYDPERLFLS